jgi:hypothetical protein
MYYIGIDSNDSNKLIYYCRHCGNTDSMITTDGLCVLKTEIEKGEQKFNHIINPYTKLDPTLPRIKNIKCPNESCITNDNKKETDIIYMRYDDINMKYVYICVDCDIVWKTDDIKN